ncbi:uncharacterized protein LOC6726437 [Drosophila simulans]|uniref:GD15588 n=1 Tax=Drosophila simulans TaxID=7240 RepID=B4R7P4_DROSI|nr:uncharacterized protein LOC6726437 [Drosophila simulans]EDX18377.1 GD15588 [Drosophila simulans]KMZ10596.1 uncharacterized protein Dsimw501_GD15588 [Drosophila simulans]
MDHHTYAKSGSKKWSAEEKRDLVVQRIAADELFSRYSPKHAEPWKKFKEMAKIGDFSEIALRKQWFSMVQRYRIHKANTLGAPLNKQSIEELNKEWEFFGLIHAYMNQKTADLHSYALKEPNVEQPNHNLAIASVYSCDEAQLSPLMLGVLNDHNFGERSPPNGCEADDMDESNTSPCHGNSGPSNKDHVHSNNDELDRLLAEATARKDAAVGDGEDVCMLSNTSCQEMECGPVMIGGEVSLSNSRYNDFEEATVPTATVVKSEKPEEPSPQARKLLRKHHRKGLSEKEKYYRHRRRYEQRMEKRLMGLCTVVGHLLKQFAPDMDVQPLLALGSDVTLSSPAPSSSDEEEPEEEQELQQEQQQQMQLEQQKLGVEADAMTLRV